MADQVVFIPGSAAVCGRFQPPHNEHVDYIVSALQACDHLIIGLVSPGGSTASPARHRTLRSANPLSYEEREAVLRDILDDQSIEPGRYSIIPFDLDDGDGVPSDAPILITRCDAWSDEKNKKLSRHHSVLVIKERNAPLITGTDIRRRMAAGDESWRSMVPSATARHADRVDLAGRIRDLTAPEEALGETSR